MSVLWRILSAPVRLVIWLCQKIFGWIGKALGLKGIHREMDGTEYERYVAQYLYKNGYKKVTQTGKTGDMGVDLVAKKHGISYAVQCKYYSNPVSGNAVQEAVAGMAMYDCQRAMVVTNSHLTKGARALASANDVVVLENVIPERRTLADVFTTGRIVSIAVGAVLFLRLLPVIQGHNATSWGVYLTFGVGCYLVPRGVLALLGWLWRRRKSEKKQRDF